MWERQRKRWPREDPHELKHKQLINSAPVDALVSSPVRKSTCTPPPYAIRKKKKYKGKIIFAILLLLLIVVMVLFFDIGGFGSGFGLPTFRQGNDRNRSANGNESPLHAFTTETNPVTSLEFDYAFQDVSY